ncbi:hypothetical protein H634G_02364 [Metarhizium anisopliae BRIP 53293]|uniref:FFD box profile domain-containing protein n=1 Tax=Metarhizium anisopliae BRIP 53293 TaxID=1291518 RepID=A0A0D9P7W4_METAN|nr:hypothetical protein H634G_02364 [Metarhizium anisopliae BRIP 53293]KJK86597.1 hypothetical protein H633G_09556 [Metarhizium anisopliae BRIP 53284]
MSEFLGSRISLISKSDIRYAGTLHEINSDESTVSLENVRSFGTEGRRGRPEEEISPSDQVYEYIVFRGSDVKDLRIEEHPGIKETKPPAMPDDPAIVGARARDVQQPQQPSNGGFQPPYPPQNNFYGGPPPPNSWGRGGGPGPMPGPGFAGVPYPPPPGWLPPGQGFPPGPGPWSNPQFPGGPGGPPGPDVAQRGPPSGPSQDVKSGTGADPAKTSGPVPTEPKSLAQGGRQPANAPNPPVDSKPSAEEVKAVATNLSNGSASAKNKAHTRPTPVVPLTGNAPKPFQLPNTGKPAPSASARTASTAAPPSVEDATSAARAAVAVAMAQLGNSGSTAMDNLTSKVNEMRVHANRGTSSSRGRGRGGRQGAAKVEVPDSDFDFAQSNAKFNKEDIVKEAIASGDVIESPSETVIKEPETHPGNTDPAGPYNKSRSFFDNISSESRERAENGGQKPGGREWRGEEQRKNMETFGQGSVDGGYRNYRGRGRGRGGRGRGGYGRGGRGGNRPQYPATVADQ